MKTNPLIVILAAAIAFPTITIWAQSLNTGRSPTSMTLWPTGKMPGHGPTGVERELPSRGDNVLRITDINEPAITVFKAPGANKFTPAVIICPGGAYQILGYDKEGTEIAAWLNSIGITGVVLKYRVPNNMDGAFQDIQRAIRLVRHNAANWNSCGRFSSMGEFFDALRLIESIQIQYRFDDGYAPWIVTCQPNGDTDWHKIKAQLRALAERVPLEQRYMLSPDAVALLRWIQELRDDEIQAGLTPVLETHLGKTLSFKSEWDYRNTRIYLELLVAEINENTDYQLRALDWRDYPNNSTRILVRQKKTEIDDVVRAIQGLGLQRDKILTKEKVRQALDDLLGEK
jgi:hypothetical protein